MYRNRTVRSTLLHKISLVLGKHVQGKDSTQPRLSPRVRRRNKMLVQMKQAKRNSQEVMMDYMITIEQNRVQNIGMIYFQDLDTVQMAS